MHLLRDPIFLLYYLLSVFYRRRLERLASLKNRKKVGKESQSKRPFRVAVDEKLSFKEDFNHVI